MSSYSENRNCPRCDGVETLEHTEDEQGVFEQCIECGLVRKTISFTISLAEVNKLRAAVGDLEPLSELTLPTTAWTVQQHVISQSKRRLNSQKRMGGISEQELVTMAIMLETGDFVEFLSWLNSHGYSLPPA
jgi:Zn ribbon nucleic-acid-binding protein